MIRQSSPSHPSVSSPPSPPHSTTQQRAAQIIPLAARRAPVEDQSNRSTGHSLLTSPETTKADAPPDAELRTSSSTPNLALLLPFAPFVAFVLGEQMWGAVLGLSAGALSSIALLVYGLARRERSVNVLEAGSALMFTALALVAASGDASMWTVWRVRLCVDAGLALIVLVGLAVGRPFSEQAVGRRLPPERVARADFRRANTLISGVWATAFAIAAAIDALMVLRPATPTRLAVFLTVAALLLAMKVTKSQVRALLTDRHHLSRDASK